MPSFAMIGLAYVECDKPYLGVFFLTLGIALMGFANGGYLKNLFFNLTFQPNDYFIHLYRWFSC